MKQSIKRSFSNFC